MVTGSLWGGQIDKKALKIAHLFAIAYRCVFIDIITFIKKYR